VSVHPRISVSAVSSWNNTFDEDIELWAAVGIDRVGLSLAKLLAAGVERSATRVRDAGLTVTNVVAAGGFMLDDESSWLAGRARLEDAIHACVTVSAGCLVVTTGRAAPMTWEDAASRFADAMAPVLQSARSADVKVALEHTNPFRTDVSFVHTLRDALDLAERMDIGVCVETNACWAERDIDTTLATGIPHIALVQVSDHAIGTLRSADRLVPGDGDIPLGRLVGALGSAGYTGAYDIELIGPHIEAEGYRSAITRSLAAVENLIDGGGRDPTP